MNVVVRACYLYPVKACAGIQVEELSFAESGQIIGDRQWVVVDERRCMTWIGAIPRLALVRPQVAASGWALAAPTGEAVTLPPAGEGEPCTVQAWNGERGAFDVLTGCDAGDAVAQLVSEVAGERLRLAWLNGTQHLPNPVHLTTVSSLQQLAADLGTSLSGVAGQRRFRPNVVLEAPDGAALEPFAEERAETFHGRSLTLDVTDRCARCIVIDVDPDTAEKDTRYFVGAKASSAQRHPGAPAYFGLYARPRAAGRLAVGDTLEMRVRE